MMRIGTWVVLVMMWVVLPDNAFAIMPPREIAQKNLEAELILIGEVMEMGAILLPDAEADPQPKKELFVMKVLHVVKGFERVQVEESVRVTLTPMQQSKDGVGRMTQGILTVDVKVGNLVVTYLNPSKYEGFYQPLFGGSSVVVIVQSIR